MGEEKDSESLLWGRQVVGQGSLERGQAERKASSNTGGGCKRDSTGGEKALI